VSDPSDYLLDPSKILPPEPTGLETCPAGITIPGMTELPNRSIVGTTRVPLSPPAEPAAEAAPAPADVERVLVVPTADVWSTIAPFQGFAPGTRADLDALLRQAVYVDRPAAEEDPSLKQLIPYILLVRFDRPYASSRVLHYRRAGSEKRLVGRRSLGIGGHVNPCDHAADPLTPCLQRELEEEAGFVSNEPPHLLGFLNDDSEPVGRVHLGLVYVQAANGGNFAGKTDAELLHAAWDKLPTVQVMMDDPKQDWETWSRLAFAAFCRIKPDLNF
jgi:predicted NUDIX family phosphoesterase